MNTISMTGFGAASQPTALGLLQIDIKSVNSRFFEFNARLP
ncbi:MAG: YicC-like family, N-terminal region, partial [Pseudomonadota bacterium]